MSAKLVAKRTTLKSVITRLVAYANGPLDNATVIEIKTKLDMLESTFVRVFDNQIELNELSGESALQYEEIEFDAIQTLYETAKIKLLTVLALSTERPNVPAVENRNAKEILKLPQLQIPKFNGDYTAWTSFKDLFMSSIGLRDSLTGAQKLHYLKSFLEDDAAQLLRSYQVTDANFSAAWIALDTRYNNKRLLVNAQFKKLFGQPSLNVESASAIRKLIDTTTECVRALNALELPTEEWDSVLVFIVSERLDSETHKQWEISLAHNDLATYEQLSTFLEQRCRSLEAVGKFNIVSSSSSKRQSTNPTKERSSFHVQTNGQCVLCSAGHSLANCEKFVRLRTYDRRNLCKRRRLCFVCFDTDHTSAECNASSCSYCGSRHHDLLHFNQTITTNNQQQSASTETTNTSEQQQSASIGSSSVTTHFGKMSSHVLLATAWIKLAGTNELLRVLLDSGSQASLITESCVQRLNLPRTKVAVTVNGLSASHAANANAMVSLTLQSCIDHTFVVNVNALVLRKLTGLLPSVEISASYRADFPGIVLADPEYFKPGKIDMLIGADIYGQLLRDGLISGGLDTPTAQNTALGWVLLGNVPKMENNIVAVSMHVTLDSELRRFWEVEEIESANPFTSDEEKCEQYFQSTHSRTAAGRYVVRIPFDESTRELGNSRTAAMKRLLQVERRLSGDAHLQEQYVSFMREYAEMGHMKRANGDPSSDSLSYYLPHHCVLKESSSTTKLRVVFDASSKSSTGISLNERQFIGPRLQDDLFAIVVRFRQHRIALTADIAKMYRQVLVDERDRDFQRILWREHPNQRVEEWILNTVTYGMAAAPYLAIRSLRQLAIDEANQFPNAAKIVTSDFYVDDMITGCESSEDAVRLHEEIRKLLHRGGFDLRKWSTNDESVSYFIPAELRGADGPLNLHDDAAIKTLGLHWHPQSDSFGFKVNIPCNNSLPTKRTILSVVARLFDPLGLLSPTIILAKLIMQRLWIAGIGWDDEVPENIKSTWLAYCGSLQHLETIRIPRWLGTTTMIRCQIHAFCDASESAYGAAVYTRCQMGDGSIRVTLVSAKTKVAPIDQKQLTIARLELCGATLATKLIKIISTTFTMEIDSYYAWCDSQIVLCWLQKIPRTWKPFVGNRVAQIQSCPVPVNWQYIASESNPADCASRGLMPNELPEHPLWFTGPEWLQKDMASWPCYNDSITNETEEEKRAIDAYSLNIVDDSVAVLLRSYSSLRKLKRVTAYVLRFGSNTKLAAAERNRGPLSAGELRSSLMVLIRYSQRIEFADDLVRCNNGENLARNSKLINLNPFIDAEGVLRVGGRLKPALLAYDITHPIILSQKCELINLIIADAHSLLLHGGIQLTLSHIRRTYWIINARNCVRQFIHRCVTCFRQKPQTCQQLMGNLPMERTTPCRPFQRTGVDYAGPIILKSSSGRGNRTIKGYIALFVCFTTRALHLEMVSDLSTAAFLAAFRRFSARRGKCSDMFSDCGTNFVGAKREIGDITKVLKSKEHNSIVSSTLANDGTNWHLIPAGSPHFGGLWEAGVKAVKHHLRRAIGLHRLTFEEMATVLTEIEACLNSRPLCALSDDPNDLSALSPAHFLIGESSMVVYDRELTEVPMNRLTRWKLVKRMTQQFWNRWNEEYITTLNARPKWREIREDVRVGQLVLVKDERLPPAKWLLARITHTHPGADGKIRVATIKYNGGTTTRTINKLCVLPIE